MTEFPMQLSAPTQSSKVLGRREALSLGVVLGCCGGTAQAQTSSPPRSMRPQVGDLLVRAVASPSAAGSNAAETPRVAEPLRPGDIVRDAPQLLVWAKDPATDTVRDGSKLNQALLLHLDPESLDAETRARSVDGIIAYSASCTHSLCPVSQWRKEAGVLFCPCHSSEFDPRAGAKVVGGPALRRLPALPLRLGPDGSLQVAQPFSGRVGGPAA